MTFEQLKSFLAIVKHNHFTLAAQDLFISQSSISKQIKSLEKEIGVELFKREHRSIKLTPAGEEFLLFAKKTVQSCDEIKSIMNKYRVEESTTLSIGVTDTMVEYGLATLIGDFHKEYPNIHIELIERGNKSILEYLNTAKINLGFINTLNTYKDILESHELFTDNLVLVTSNNNNLDDTKSISLYDTHKEKYISLNSDSSMHNIFLNIWGNLNFFPDILYIDSHTKTLLALVSEDIGITIIPCTVANSFKNNINKNIKIINLKNNISSKILLVNSKNRQLTKNEAIFKKFAIKWFNVQVSNESTPLASY